MNFQDLPLDVHQTITSHLPIEDILFGYLAASKTTKLIALECLKMFRTNTVDVMVTGCHQTSVSSVFRELIKNDVHGRSFMRATSVPSDIYKIKVGSGCYANVFHPNIFRRSRLSSYTLYGITQCVVVVLQANSPVPFVRELLWATYAMSGHMNIIFVIDEMDKIQFSYQSYTALCQSITEECKKLSETLADNISFIPSFRGSAILSSATSDEMPWYSDRSLCNKLAELSQRVRMPVCKYFKPANIVIIMSRKLKLEKELQAKARINGQFGTNTYFRLFVGYVTDGLVCVGSTVWMNPLNYQKRGKMKGQEAPKFACKVESIQYFNQHQRAVAAGNFVGLIVKLDSNNETIVTYKKQKILLNMWLERAKQFNYVKNGNPLELKKFYHVLTTTPNATSYQRLEIQVAMLGSKSAPFDSWSGKLTENYSPGFYSFGLRTFCTIKKIISVHDVNGDEIKFEENQPKTVSKGQKATLEVMLAAPSPLTLFDRKKNNDSYNNSEGRCCLVVNSTAVAIGIVTKLLELEADNKA